MTPTDDFAAPWSAWGSTQDGFRKPELAAPGRVLNGPVPMDSTMFTSIPLAQGRRRVHVDVGDVVRRPDRLGRSGNGALAAPGLDAGSGQGRIDGLGERARPATTRRVRSASASSNIAGAIAADGRANPNAGLNRFVVTDPATGLKTFDADRLGSDGGDRPGLERSLLVERELVVGLVVERELVVGFVVERELVVGFVVERELVVGVVVEHVRGRVARGPRMSACLRSAVDTPIGGAALRSRGR